jgi:chemotaxis protein MotA
MPNAVTSLLDPGAFTVVVAGTVLASAARCGWREFGGALREAGTLLRPGFNEDANRKALARAVSEIQRDGTHRANPALPPDRALGLMLETFLRHGSLDAMHRARRAERALDEARRITAAQVFGWAGELAPVFGLIGTLYGLAQLAPPGSTGLVGAAIMTAVSTAVLTSLYGALLAHLVCHPLASAIERRGLRYEQQREALAEWFAEQVAAHAHPPRDGRAHLRGVA